MRVSLAGLFNVGLRRLGGSVFVSAKFEEGWIMRAALSDVTLIVDRSGSMPLIRKDAEGGINAFLEAQRAVAGELLVTLVQFDNEYEFVCRGVPLSQVPPYSLEPRGSTALLDAVRRSTDEAGV